MKKLLIAASAILLSGAAHAQIINGGFETPGVSGSCCSTVAAPGSFNGWTVTTGDINLVTGTYGSTGGNLAYQGNQYLDLIGQRGSGAISQTFNTVAGQTYNFSFAYAHNIFDGLGSASASYSFGNQSGIITHNTGTTSNLNWQLFTGSFLASGPTTTISFANTVGSQNAGVLLDAVNVTAVPEASTWALMIMGFGLMGASMRRRKAMTFANA